MEYEIDFVECKWLACLCAERLSGYFQGIGCRFFLRPGDKAAARADFS